MLKGPATPSEDNPDKEHPDELGMWGRCKESLARYGSALLDVQRGNLSIGFVRIAFGCVGGFLFGYFAGGDDGPATPIGYTLAGGLILGIYEYQRITPFGPNEWDSFFSLFRIVRACTPTL